MLPRFWLFASVASVVFALAWSAPAEAYPWMIRHEYGGCATCHTDPSGAGVLNPYGRAQSAILLSSRYGAVTEAEPGPVANFLFGAIPTPEWLLLEGWIRNGLIKNYSNESSLASPPFLQMVADLAADVRVGAFRASATIGYNVEDFGAGSSPNALIADSTSLSERAWVTSKSSAGNIVSRVHWAGLSFDDDAGLVRVGRLNLPFGLRNIEHTSWVRTDTRTDINQDQQHGLAVSYSGEHMRGEVMAILGNYQIAPDRYRERGYSAFAELALGTRYALGISSLVTHANADILTQLETTRQSHGLFVRAAPLTPLALLGEFDALVTAAGDSTRAGFVGFAQADVEPIQGVHGILTGEVLNRPALGETTQLGAWIGAAWFVVPHVDARVDAIRRSASGAPSTTTILFQLHVYL